MAIMFEDVLAVPVRVIDWRFDGVTPGLTAGYSLNPPFPTENPPAAVYTFPSGSTTTASWAFPSTAADVKAMAFGGSGTGTATAPCNSLVGPLKLPL
jgi:hypothetical protein